MERYFVLLSRDEPVPANDLATPLAEVLKTPAVEITRQIRDRPWVLLDDVPATALDAVFDVLVAKGVSAKAVPGVHMPTLPPALRLRYGEPLPKGMFLQRAAPPAPALLPWKGLRIVSAGYVHVKPEESLGVEMLPGTPGSAPMGAGGKREKDVLLVDLIGELRLRVDAAEYNYDYLGERMQPSSRENVRLLLTDIRERAPHARFTDRTALLMGGRPTSDYRFRSLEAFETFNRWILQAVDEEALGEAE